MKIVLTTAIFIALSIASSSWAEMLVDFGGPILEKLGGGKVGMNLEIRSAYPLKGLRIEADSRFPFELHDAKMADRIRWKVHQTHRESLKMGPGRHGKPLRDLDFQLRLKPKRGRTAEMIFGSGARDRRPSFWMIGIRNNGQEDRTEVFLPYLPTDR